MSRPSSPTTPISPWPPFPEPSAETHPNAKEAYGFLAVVSTTLLAVVFVVWAVVPGRVLESWGVEWYPDREWAILLPSYSVILVLLAYFVYAALMLFNTPPLSSLSLLTDERARTAPPSFDHSNPDLAPEAWDMPLSLVCEMKYGRKRPL